MKVFKNIMRKTIMSLIEEDNYIKLRKEVDYFFQKKTAKKWNKIIENYFSARTSKYNLKSKKNLETSKIIWQFWGQGWIYSELPDIVKHCYKSVEKYKGDYLVIRLDDETIKDYVELPEFIYLKLRKNQMTYAHFADILRLALLEIYGGIWLDATVFLTDYIDKKYVEMEYFFFQRSNKSPNKYLEKKGFYFSWNDKHKVTVLNSIIFSKKNNLVIHTLLDLMLIFWESNNRVPYYYFFQILYNELLDRRLKKYRCITIDDTLPHLLFFEINEPSFDYIKIKKKISLHKLSYKVDEETQKKLINLEI